ncbi:MAG: SRPBCC domain-containing protein [Anaerolineae bacterium]
MKDVLVANAQIEINAPVALVWQALVQPEMIKQYMFGTTVISDWNVGSPIVWKGEWEGRSYEDKGVLLEFQPEHLLQYTHFSPLSGQPDTPDNYHTVTIEVSPMAKNTFVRLTQDNNGSEAEREHSEKNWQLMLSALKHFVEKASGTG